MQQRTLREGAGILIRARSTGRALLQQRGPEARDHQGTWDLSASGGIEEGETPLQAATRELAEEIGPTPRLIIMSTVTLLRSADEASDLCSIFTAFEAWCAEEFTPQIPDTETVSGIAWTRKPWEHKLHPCAGEDILALEAVRNVPRRWLGRPDRD
jgi:8-oxo-dGTP pyrophosphatase MutT (NUDIX family)